MTNANPNAPKVTVSTATGQRQCLTGTADHAIPDLPPGFPREGHAMPGFQQSLIGVGPICDAGFTVTFLSMDVVICNKNQTAILSEWWEIDGGKLWHFDLQPADEELPGPMYEP